MDYEIMILIILSIISLIATHCKPLSLIIIAAVVCYIFFKDHTTFVKEKNFKSSYAISAAASQNLKKTENPRYKKIQPTPSDTPADTPNRPEDSEDNVKHPENRRISSTINSEDYTLQGMEKKYNEYTFKRDPSYRQTTDERTKYINSLYKDFMKENVKRDPNMRQIGDTACTTIRGTKEYASTTDC